MLCSSKKKQKIAHDNEDVCILMLSTHDEDDRNDYEDDLISGLCGEEVDQTINLPSPFQEGLMNAEILLPNTYFYMYQPYDYR